MKNLFILFLFLSSNLFAIQKKIDSNDLYKLQIVIKFKSKYKIRLNDNGLYSKTKIKNDLIKIKFLDKNRIYRMNSQITEEHLDSLHNKTEKYFKRTVGNLNDFYVYTCKDSNEVKTFLKKLKNVLIIESFYREIKGTAPMPPSTQFNQIYLNNGTNGINASDFWTTYSNRGVGVKIVDIEQGVNLNHQDLNTITPINNPGVSIINDDHGTAVAGIIMSKNNGWGTTGIASDCQYYFCPAATTTSSIASAIFSASNAISEGDIILIEQHLPGPNSSDANCVCNTTGCGYVPVEYYYNCYSVIQTAVASGRIVVEAAGNGYQNLDASINAAGQGGQQPHYPFLSGNSSGAIMVGAGSSGGQWCSNWYTTRSRLPFSNYGTRVDLQGIGDNVYSTGYGDFYNSEGVNYQYTSQFAGTSSASPMVVGAIALIQSKWRQSNGGNTLATSTILSALKSTAKPQQAGTSNPVSQNIGGLPDVVAAYNYILNNQITNDNCLQAINLNSSNTCSYQNYSVAGATASSGFTIPYCTSSTSAFAYDVWFKFTAQATTHTISVDPEGTYSGSDNNYIDPVIAVYTSCNDGSLIQCEDDLGGGGGNCDITLNGLSIGTTYFIRVFDWSGGSTVPPVNPQFGICVTHNSSTCPTPTSPVEATIGQTYVDLDWDLMSGANSYAIRYRTIGGSWNNFTNTNSNYSINNLTCNTTYEWEVSSTCSSNSSNWTTTRQFTTLACTNTCGTPQNMQTSNITDNSANLNTGNSSVFGAVGYEFRYRIVGNSNWNTAAGNGSNSNVNISGLACNTSYEWQMRTNCGNNNYSPYSATSGFTTQNCPSQFIDLTSQNDNLSLNPTFINLSHSILNIGNKNSGTFSISYILSRNLNFSTFDYILGTENISNLNAQEQKQINKTFDLCSSSIPNDKYYFGYLIDNTNLITESNKSNNFRTFADDYSKNCSIDLISNNSTYNYNSPILKWNMGVQNIGNIDVQNVNVSFYLSRSKNFTTLDYFLGEEILAQVSGNSNAVTFNKEFNLCSANVVEGFYYFGFIIDKNNTIIEQNENNTYWGVDSVYFKCGNSSINSIGNVNSKISIFPNPTNGDIFISNISNGKLIELYSIDGKKLKEEFTKEKINISDKVNGTYILKIDNNTFKISLNR